MPRVLIGILKEELAHSRQTRRIFERKLRQLGKGSLVAKRIGGHRYYYLAVRDGRRVRFRYLGKLSNEERSRWADRDRERRLYRHHLREVRQQLRILERALRGC